MATTDSQKSAGKDAETGTQSVSMKNSTAGVENSLVLPQGIPQKITKGFRNSISGCKTKRGKGRHSKRCVITPVHYSGKLRGINNPDVHHSGAHHRGVDKGNIAHSLCRTLLHSKNRSNPATRYRQGNPENIMLSKTASHTHTQKTHMTAVTPGP